MGGIRIMKSKTSCINKAIFRKNMSCSAVSAVYLAYLFFHMTVRMFLNTRSYITALSADTVSPANFPVNGHVRKHQRKSGNHMLSFLQHWWRRSRYSPTCFPPAAAIWSCTSGKRSELFVTNYISGFLFLLLPQLITFLQNLIVCILNNISSVDICSTGYFTQLDECSILNTCRIFAVCSPAMPLPLLFYYFVGHFLYIAIKSIATLIVSSHVLWHENPWRSGQHYIDRNQECCTFTFCVSAKSCIPELVHEQWFYCSGSDQ